VRIVGGAAESDMAGDQTSAAFFVTWFDIPALVEQVSDLSPVRVFHQQVVPLGDDQRNISGYRDRRSDRLLDRAVEQRSVDDRIFSAVQPPQQIHIAGRIEGIDGTFALIPTEPPQLGVAQVKAVHAHQHRFGGKISFDGFGQCGFAGARRSGDPKEAA